MYYNNEISMKNKKEKGGSLTDIKMNILDKMIESERIYGADEPWAEYREALTDFIIANCRERGLPTLAIFGVGEAWDLDLRRLSEHYRLILIDRDIDGMKRAIDRYGVKEAVVADIPFCSTAMRTHIYLKSCCGME